MAMHSCVLQNTGNVVGCLFIGLRIENHMNSSCVCYITQFCFRKIQFNKICRSNAILKLCCMYFLFPFHVFSVSPSPLLSFILRFSFLRFNILYISYMGEKSVQINCICAKGGQNCEMAV